MRAASIAAQPIAALRPLRQSDVEAVARWYDQAVVLAGERRSLSDLLDSSSQVLVLIDGRRQEPVALILPTIDDPEDGWATVTLLIVSQEERELAARGIAFLEAALRLGVEHVRVAVPADVGLALYFWLRLGYRPIAAGDRLWMIRELEG